MKKSVVVVIVLAVLAGNAMATALIGRSATVNKFLQVFGWANFGYNQTATRYDWPSSAWTTDGVVPLKTTSCDLTVAVGLLGNVDLNVVAPLAMKQQDTASSTGLGDVMAYARWGVLQTSLLPVKVALVLGANLPTTDTTVPIAVRLGDRTTDIGVGAAVVTSSFFGFVGHARAGYWVNGKLNDTTKVGNMFEYLVVLDYSITKKLAPELALSGYSRSQTGYNGTPKPTSEVSQHAINFLLMWKPLPMLVIRPKVAVPLTSMSKGGSLAKAYGGLDIWVTLP